MVKDSYITKTVFAIMVLVLVSSIVSISYAVSEYEYYIPAARASKESPAFLYLLNTGKDDVETAVTLHYEKNVSLAKMVVARSEALTKIDLSAYDKTGLPFSIKVRSAAPLVVERVQQDSANSAGYGTTAADSARQTWMFAEGYSTGSAKTILYLFNPSDQATEVTVTVFTDEGSKKVFSVDLPKGKMKQLDMKEEIYSQNRYGLKVSSKVPIVAEAHNSNKLMSGGAGSIGGQQAKTWYIAGGYLSDQATDFLNILNPGFNDLTVKVNVYYADGETSELEVKVDHLMKKYVMLNNHIRKEVGYSLVVESPEDIVVELTHHDEPHSACHGGLGETEAAKEWRFAAGNGRDNDQLAVLNPGMNNVLMNITIYYTGGKGETIEYVAPKGSSTFDIGAVAGEEDFGLKIISSEPVVVENIVYDKNHDSGYSTYGVKDKIGMPEITEPVKDREIKEDNITGMATDKDDRLVLLKKQTYPHDSLGLSGLVKAQKTTYEYAGEKILLWELTFSRENTAIEGLQAILSGDLIDVQEYSKLEMQNLDVYSLASTKSEGYTWQEDDKIKVVLAKDDEDAMRVAEFSMSPEKKGFWTLKNILLVVLVVLILWLVYRRFRRSEEDNYDWEDDEIVDDIEVVGEPTAQVKPAEKKKKKATTKKPAKKAPVKKAKTVKRSSSKAKAKPVKREKAETKKEPTDEKPSETKKEPADEKSSETKKEPEIKIERMKDPVDTAVVDEGEWLDYDQVFRHVNRDGDEITRDKKE